MLLHRVTSGDKLGSLRADFATDKIEMIAAYNAPHFLRLIFQRKAPLNLGMIALLTVDATVVWPVCASKENVQVIYVRFGGCSLTSAFATFNKNKTGVTGASHATLESRTIRGCDVLVTGKLSLPWSSHGVVLCTRPGEIHEYIPFGSADPVARTCVPTVTSYASNRVLVLSTELNRWPHCQCDTARGVNTTNSRTNLVRWHAAINTGEPS